jgi:hypothetical protein
MELGTTCTQVALNMPADGEDLAKGLCLGKITSIIKVKYSCMIGRYRDDW